MDSIRTKYERKVNSRLIAGQAAQIPENFFSKHPHTPSRFTAIAPHFDLLLTLRLPILGFYEEILRNASR